MSNRGKVLSFAAAAILLLAAWFVLAPAKTSAANPGTINFQGKVTNSDGTNVSNGTYTFIFRLYDAASPTTTSTCALNASCWWEETDSLVVTNGVFQVELGASCAFTSACNSSHSGIDFSTENALYLTFKFNGDAAGFMSPTMHLTSVPYAYNSDKLGGISSSGYVQLTPGSAQSGNINISGSLTAGSALSFSAVSAATIQPAAAQALTITGHAASTWSTDAGDLTLQAGSGTVSLGTSTILTAGGSLTVKSGSGAVTLDSASGTSVTAAGDSFNGAGGLNTGSGTGTQRIDASGNLVSIGNITHASGNVTETLGAASNTFILQSSASVAYLTADTANTKVQIGSATSDATQINLALDQFNTYTDTGTCNSSASSPNGAMYYNTVSNSVRACISGGWEDMVSTSGLGIIAFGVVPDSTPNLGSAGDLAGIGASGANGSGPCKVYLGSTTKAIRWTSCIAYSGGRKVVVAAQTTDYTFTAGQLVASSWAHICLNGTNNQVKTAFTTGTETANLPAFSANNPVLCLADVSTSGSAITGIYDTRTFTTSLHTFAQSTTAMALGVPVITSGTSVAQVGASATANIAGIVVASAGATTGTPNLIISVGGPAWAKATAGTAGGVVITSTTAGRVTTGTSVAGPYGDMGLQRSSTWSATCTAATASTCQLSDFFDILLR